MKQFLFSICLVSSGLLLSCQTEGPQQVTGLPTLSEVDKQPADVAKLPAFVAQAHALADSAKKVNDDMPSVYLAYAEGLDEWFASSKRTDAVKQDARFLQAASLLTHVMRQIPQTYRLVDAMPRGGQRSAASSELSQLAYNIAQLLPRLSAVTQLDGLGNQQLDTLGPYALAQEQQLATIRHQYGLTTSATSGPATSGPATSGPATSGL